MTFGPMIRKLLAIQALPGVTSVQCTNSVPVIVFDPLATTQQQSDAQSALAAINWTVKTPRTAKLIATDVLALTQAQQLKVAAAMAGYVLSRDPAFAAELAAAIGITITAEQ